MGTVETLTAERRGRLRLFGVVLLASLAWACGPGNRNADDDDRCALSPPAGYDYGSCEQLLGAYYDPLRGACLPVSGCTCDDACQEAIPFSTIADCEQACTNLDPQ